MGLFGDWFAKRQPVDRSATSRRSRYVRGADPFAPQKPARTQGPSARQPLDRSAVEVSEFNVDEEDFSTMFGPPTTQFAEMDLGRDEPSKVDPWASMLRRD